MLRGVGQVRVLRYTPADVNDFLGWSRIQVCVALFLCVAVCPGGA